jgi:radical SAM protein with 4Fe4S-binding SPASM domain
LHKDFAKIFDFCTDHLDHVAVLTNGTILSDALTDRFAAVAGKLLMSISLDGSTAEAHDFRRGVKGSFQRTCRNLERLATLGIRIRVAMSVDEDNYDDVENTLLLARRLGAFAFSYQPVMPIGRGKEWAPLQWSLDVHQVILSETRLREQYADFLSIMPKEKVSDLERGKNCGAGHRVYTMDPWGNIRPCATFGTEQLVIGNLREQSVEEVFSNPLTRLLADFLPPRPETCGGCRMELYCRYCGLRGMMGHDAVDDCRWARDPVVQEILTLSLGTKSESVAPSLCTASSCAG